MQYTIKMMSKTEINITENEYQKLISSKATGLVFIESIKGTINLNSVESILPENIITNKNEMRLHDGTYAVKKYGIWVDVNNSEVRIDPYYYPEIIKKDNEEDKKRIEENSTINLDNI